MDQCIIFIVNFTYQLIIRILVRCSVLMYLLVKYISDHCMFACCK